ARSSSTKWSSTKTCIGSATSEAPRAFSSGSPSKSADARQALRRHSRTLAQPRPLEDVDDRVTRIDVEAGGGEKCGADVAGEERVAAPAVCGCDPLRLGERVDSEAAGAFEPALVASTRECLEECEAVARGAVAETVAFLVSVGACLPDQLGTRDQELL